MNIMEIKSTFPVHFDEGIGHLQFPANLKRSTATTICCYNLYIEDENEGKDQCLSLKCDSSYFREEENFSKQLNTLAVFPFSSKTKYFSFYNPPLPLTVTPETIYFRIVDNDGVVKKISATALIHIDGICRERVRNI